MAQPAVTDYRAIIDALRRHGSVHYPRTAVPREFTAWRRRLRQVARLTEVRISVTRSIDYILIENRDYEVSDDDSRALTDVIEAQILGRDLTYDDAVHARSRQGSASRRQWRTGTARGGQLATCEPGSHDSGGANGFSVLFFGDWSRPGHRG